MSDWWRALHFIQPDWLWLLACAPLIFLAHHLRHDVRAVWKRYIDSDLLDHLIVRPQMRWRLRPIHMICVLIMLSAVALAGPAWKREQPPFTEDKAPLVIALDLSQTMDAIDLDPTRVERAKLKLRDLLKVRNGARTALFVYAGTSHMVLPFTTDISLFELYLDSLSTSLMPGGGKDSARALDAIAAFLKDESVPGTILFVTDGIEPRALPSFRRFATANADKNELLIMGVGTSQGAPIRISGNHFLDDSSGRRIFSRLDINTLRDLSSNGISATTLTLDDDDIQWIQRRVQHHLEAVQQRDSKTRWINEGYWLTIPIAVIAAFWFRKGWTVRWTSSAMSIALLIAWPGANSHFSWLDLWLTPDQQGRYYLERGENRKAAAHFKDTIWRGIAYARAHDDGDALNSFALSDSAEGWYNQGNALAHLGRFSEADQSYRQALTRRPAWHEAEDNLELVQSLIPKDKKKDGDEKTEAAPNLPPDEVKFDDKGKNGKKTIKIKVDPAKMADIWMRNIQTTPADFLRLRFAIQAAQEQPK